eukprot:g2020.t1
MTQFHFVARRPSSTLFTCPSHKKTRYGSDSTRDRLRCRSPLSCTFRKRSSSPVFTATLVSKKCITGNDIKLDTVSYNRLQENIETESHSFQNNAMRLVHPSTKEFKRVTTTITTRRRRESDGCPVYVMLPLDTVVLIEKQGSEVSKILMEHDLEHALHKFKDAGVHGIMVDIWWGIVEREGPKMYDFSAYEKLLTMVENTGLKAQAVMSFHAAGKPAQASTCSNVGDTCEIPLPRWVTDVGTICPDVFYTDRQGIRNEECLSLGCDHQALFEGRTPVEIYRDFVDAFANRFQHKFGDVITEITVGLGPAGELRYPAYPEGDGRWTFPGVGEFQCYDKFMLESLKQAAKEAGHEDWASGGPHDAGHYNSKCWETEFFNCQSGRFDSSYGRFFLNWYSTQLINHADSILKAISETLQKNGRPKILKSAKQDLDGSVVYEFAPAVTLGIKLAGVHWWFKSRSHAAELTAGYYNTRTRDGYAPIMEMLKKRNASLSFTCVEMRDCEHPPESMCSPQGLLKQVITGAKEAKVPLSGENALQRYDEYALSRITESAVGEKALKGSLQQITFLRMGGLMFENWNAFSRFLSQMRTPPTPAALN